MGLTVWSVFCLGVGLLLGTSAPEAKTKWSISLMLSLGIACFLWASGYALWAFVAGVVPG